MRNDGKKENTFRVMEDNKSTQCPSRRKHYVLSKKFQQKFVLSFIALGLVVAGCVILGLWYYSAKEVNEQLYRAHSVPSKPWDAVFPVMLKAAIIFVIVQVAVSSVLTRLIFNSLSHKLKTFNSALEKIGNSDLATPLAIESFNGLDQKLEETRLNLNRMISALKSIHKKIREVAAAPVMMKRY